MATISKHEHRLVHLASRNLSKAGRPTERRLREDESPFVTQHSIDLAPQFQGVVRIPGQTNNQIKLPFRVRQAARVYHSHSCTTLGPFLRVRKHLRRCIRNFYVRNEPWSVLCNHFRQHRISSTQFHRILELKLRSLYQFNKKLPVSASEIRTCRMKITVVVLRRNDTVCSYAIHLFLFSFRTSQQNQRLLQAPPEA